MTKKLLVVYTNDITCKLTPQFFQLFSHSSLEQDVINGPKHAWRSLSDVPYSVDFKYNAEKRGRMKFIRPVAMKSKVEMSGSG